MKRVKSPMEFTRFIDHAIKKNINFTQLNKEELKMMHEMSAQADSPSKKSFNEPSHHVSSRYRSEHSKEQSKDNE